MITFEQTKVLNFDGAVRGMRNPMNSWDRSDSYYNNDEFIIGPNDWDLMKRLAKAGSDHRKYLRQIIVSVDITAPLYWWKEFDTYKVGTVANSCSTMHKLTSKEIDVDDFSISKAGHPYYVNLYKDIIAKCEDVRKDYIAMIAERDAETDPKEKAAIDAKAKEAWRFLIQMLPCGYNQKRTVTLNYENLVNMLHSRSSHKLKEWHTFCAWIDELPHNQIIKIAAGKDDQ